MRSSVDVIERTLYKLMLDFTEHVQVVVVLSSRVLYTFGFFRDYSRLDSVPSSLSKKNPWGLLAQGLTGLHATQLTLSKC